MKTKTLSLSTILGFLGVILMVHAFNSHASTGEIKCSTAFGEKKFIIDSDKVSFYKEEISGPGRTISSTEGASVRTQNKHLGFSKTLYIDGLKYKINIHNQNQFSEVDDYLSITSPKGHEMTYPLNCQSA